MTITHEDDYDYEREITFEIAGSQMVLPVVISDLVIEIEVWEESGNAKDYEAHWTSAKVEIGTGGAYRCLWEDIVEPKNLETGRNLADATLSDILDEIAEEAFLRDYRAGEIVA